MVRRSIRLIAIVLAVSCWLATGKAQETRVFGTVTVPAPVTLLPDEGRTPLATLTEGTEVQVLAKEEGWYRISFQDSYLWGDRIGYVRAEHVKVSAAVKGVPLARPLTPGAPVGRLVRGSLDDESIAIAITSGIESRGRQSGLRLLDNGQPWTGWRAVGGAAGRNTAIRLQVHTPLTWIRQVASEAAREGRRFTPSDLTADMTAPVLRVVAYVEAAASSEDARLRRIVLRGERDGVVQPISHEPFSEHVMIARGGASVFEGLRTTFPMDAVRRLRGETDDELVLVIIGARGTETRVRLTKAHLDALPM